jgi:hypothetical protein
MPASSRVLPTRGGRTQGRSRAPGSNSGSVGSATVRVTPYGRHHASVRRTPARDCAEWHQHGSPSNESSRSSKADSPASIRRLRGADRPSLDATGKTECGHARTQPGMSERALVAKPSAVSWRALDVRRQSPRSSTDVGMVIADTADEHPGPTGPSGRTGGLAQSGHSRKP